MKRQSLEHIYVISAGDLVKIGTARNPRARRKELQTGNGMDLVLEMHVGWPATGCMLQLEKGVIHPALRRWKTRGEWFSCDLNVAIGCVLDATQCLICRSIFYGTGRAKAAVVSCLAQMRGEDDLSQSYDLIGSEPPWPRGAFWWCDKPGPGGVFGFTWMDKEIGSARSGAKA